MSEPRSSRSRSPRPARDDPNNEETIEETGFDFANWRAERLLEAVLCSDLSKLVVAANSKIGHNRFARSRKATLDQLSTELTVLESWCRENMDPSLDPPGTFDDLLEQWQGMKQFVSLMADT